MQLRTGSDDLDGKYLVVQFTEGTGEAAKVAVVMISPNNKYYGIIPGVGNKGGCMAYKWNAGPCRKDMGVTIYVHASGE